MPLPESVFHGSADDFIYVQNIKVSFEEARKKGDFFLILKANEERKLRSRKYKANEEINWAIEEKFSSSSKLSICLVKSRFLLPNKKITFPDADVKELCVHSTCTLRVQSARVCVSLERKETGPFVEIIRRLLEESRQRLSNMKVFLENLGKACEVLNRVARCVEPITEIHPAVKAAVSAVTLLYEACKKQREVHEAATELISDISSFLPFADLQTDPLRSTMVEKTASAILELFEKVIRAIIKYSSDTILGDLLMDRMGEMESYKEEFGRLKEIFDWCIKVEIWKTTQRIDTRTEQLILSQLHPVPNAFYDAGKSCFQNTRQSVLLTLKEWSSHDSGLFWLYGEEGVGKTTIAHTLAHMLDEEDRLAACFFWKKNDRDRRQAERLLPTLAYQLAKWHADYRAIILDVLESHDERAIHTGLRSQFELLFKIPFSTLSQGKFSESQPPCERDLVIVLDGLDESCDSIPARRALASTVRDIASLVPWLKVFISSRRPPELEDCFQLDETHHLNLDYPPYDLQRDIQVFVEQSSIKVRADGNAPASDEISETFACDAIYYRFINNVLDGQRHDVDMVPLVRNILAVASCITLNRPLPEEALIHFVETFHPELPTATLHESIVSLKPLLFANAESKLVLIFPVESFLGFLSSRDRSGWISVDVGSINTAIARQCLDTMRSHLRFNICEIESSYFENAEIPDLGHRVKSNISESLQYSCLYWMEHITRGTDGRVLQDRAASLLCSPMALYWFEVLSLLSALDVGKGILLQCQESFQDNQEIMAATSKLTTFLDDFHSAMKTSTPHVYVSALSWRIGDPFIRKHLATEFRCHFPLLFDDTTSTTEPRDTFWVVRDTRKEWNTVRFANCVAHSPNKEKIASGGEDGTIRIWESQTGRLVVESRKGHNSFVRAVAFSPDSTKLLSGSDDGVLCIWDAQRLISLGEPFKVSAGHVSAVQFSPDGRRVASAGAALRIWDLETRAALCKPWSVTSGNKRYTINCLRYSGDGNRIVLGCYDRTVRIWDTSNCCQVGPPLHGHNAAVTAVSWSADDNRIASASENGDIFIWDHSTGERILGPLKGHSTSVTSVEFVHEEERIATGSLDGTLIIWDARHGDQKEIVRRGEEYWDPNMRCYMAIPTWWPELIAPTTKSVLPSFQPEPGPLILEDDGWLRTQDRRLVLWVPSDYRPSLQYLSKSRTDEGAGQPRRLNWTYIYRGKSWISIHGRSRDLF